MQDAMIVVAVKRGYYGGKTRYEGERFAIASPTEFSKNWMVDASGPGLNRDVQALEQTYKTANAMRASSRTITDEQLLAEISQSAGVAASLRAENIQLKEKISELTGQLDQLLAGAKAGSAGRSVREGAGRFDKAEEGAAADARGAAAPEEGEEAFGGEPKDDDVTGAAPGVGTIRVTRRR